MMNTRERIRRFRAVARHFHRVHQDLEAVGLLPYRLTALGAWACSRPHHLFYFFSKLDLGQYRVFIDLGSGDGIATCVAALFTRALGIEVDPDLCRLAAGASRSLGLAGRADFVCGDYRRQPIRRADCLYVYPERPLDSLEPLLVDWQGTLLVYGHHFPPTRLSALCCMKCGRERITAYRDLPR